MKKALTIYLLFISFLHYSQTISFTQAPGSPITNNQNQQGFMSKDFNGDGFKDLIVGNAYGNNLYVFMGLGTGQFTLAPGSPIGSFNGPIYSASADFNSDNIADLAVANYNNGNVKIYLGTGNGSFTQAPGSPITTGSFPYCVDIADFNMDGNKDIITVNVSNTIMLLIGNGAGSFTMASGFPIAGNGAPYHVTAGFFNSDAFPDFAVANGNGNNVSVYLGTGTTVFNQSPGSPYATGSQPRTITVKDINSDNFPDMVVPNALSNNVTILLGSATASFSSAAGSPLATGAYPYQSVISDFNQDGFQDLATMNGQNNTLSFHYGNGTGAFTVAPGSPITIGNWCHPLIGDDFNNDGRTDLATGDWYATNVSILINNTPPACSLSASYNYTVGNSGLVTFINTSTGTSTTTTYSWNFGDATSTNGTNAIHTYSNSGTYTVTLIATGNSTPACQGTATQVITIPACTLSAAFSYTVGNSGLVTFINTTAGTNTNTTYTWNFGDATSTNGANASHTYSNSGSYTVTLTANNNSTPVCQGTTTQVITITLPACLLSASFSYSVGISGLVNFTSTSIGTTSNTNYFWNFGDATSGNGTTTTHIYSVTGTYTVTLTANNNTNPECYKTVSQVITITINGVGIIELPAEKKTIVSPNPTTGAIDITTQVAVGQGKIYIYDLLGREKFSAELQCVKTSINISELEDGVYFYSLFEKGNILKSGQILLIR